jgi:hypothetical protein
VNLAEALPLVLEELRGEVEGYRVRRPPQMPYWMIISNEALRASYVQGNCSMNPYVKEKECYFQHPFVHGDVIKLQQLTLVHGTEEFFKVAKQSLFAHLFSALMAGVLLLSCYYVLILKLS